MKNAEWMVQNGYKFSELRWSFTQPDICRFYLNDKNVGKVSSLSIFEAIKTWLDAEHIEPILDEAEKNYLSAVIKPFRDSVRGIEKAENLPYEMICIDTKYRYMVFPPFDKGTMYKGMKTGWRYTLEELGL